MLGHHDRHAAAGPQHVEAEPAGPTAGLPQHVLEGATRLSIFSRRLHLPLHDAAGWGRVCCVCIITDTMPVLAVVNLICLLLAQGPRVLGGYMVVTPLQARSETAAAAWPATRWMTPSSNQQPSQCNCPGLLLQQTQ